MEFIIGIGQSMGDVTHVYTLISNLNGVFGFVACMHLVSNDLVPYLKVGQFVHLFIDDFFVCRRVEIIDDVPNSSLDFIHNLFMEYSPVNEDDFDE